MAIQSFAFSYTKGYTIKIFADSDDTAYNPFEFQTASWEVTYEGNDAYIPGIVPSRFEFTAQLTGITFGTALEQVLQDSKGIFYVHLYKGLSKEWAGVITPSAGTVEVINGTRFITMVASDGFYKLDLSSSMYSFTGQKRITVQIAEMLTRLELNKYFDGIAVSETQRMGVQEVFPYEFDALYNTSCLHELVYYDDQFNYRTYREVLNDFCVTYGVRMYQDKGFIVFQDMTRVTRDEFYLYNMAGVYSGKVVSPLVETKTAIAGGTKMYLPAIRSMKINHAFFNEIIGVQPNATRCVHTIVTGTDANPVFETKDGIQVGVFLGDGSTHIDLFNTVVSATILYPGDYADNFTMRFKLYIYYGEYSYDGTSWTQGTNTYIELDESGSINAKGVPGTLGIFQSLNNFHTAAPPARGLAPLWVYLDIEQISGDPLSITDLKIKYDFRRHGTSQDVTTYYADNTARVLGQDVELNTRLGDVYDPNELGGIGLNIPQAVSLPNGNNVVDWYEDPFYAVGQVVTFNSLLYVVASRIAQQRGQPQEYYELDVNGTSRMTHFLEWGGSYYLPINLSYTWDTSRITYARFFNFELLGNQLIVRKPQIDWPYVEL
jgi:hypothetical protein